MEHAPIYRSTQRLDPRGSLFPWRRTASLASAAVGVALSGIALGYHGFSFAPDSVDDATPVSRGADLPFPGFSVQPQANGHPDAISALSSALLARMPVSPVVIESLSQAIGPTPVRQPTVGPATYLSDLDLPFVGPSEVGFDVVAGPIAEPAAQVEAAPDAASTEAVVAAPLRPVSSLAVGPRPVVQPGGTTEQMAAAEPALEEAAVQPADPPPAAVAAAKPTPRPSQPAATRTPVPTRAPTRAPTPKPTPRATPVPVHKVVPVDNDPPQDKQPAVKRPTAQPRVQASPPKQDEPRATPKQNDDRSKDNKGDKNNNKSGSSKKG
jgi:hypothetical protein